MSLNTDPLIYPFDRAPGPGQAVQIAPGVLWLAMPLPMALGHINVWALADGDGWTLVDTGMHTPDTAAAWQHAFSHSLGDRPVRRVICTHMHPDHVGTAGWLTRQFSCALWMTRLEYVFCRMLVADTHREAPEEATRFYRAAGWDEAAIADYRARFGGFGKFIYTLPESFRCVRDEEEIDIGIHRWNALIGRGHSPEHLCLYCPELKVLISGDQVLPRISSNVSVFPTEPEADPLGDWLSSIDHIARHVPGDLLVLPAHNEPFRGLHVRLARLKERHEEALERLLQALREPKRVIDLFALLFRRPVHKELLILATGETLAHLNYLMHRGLVARDLRDGVAWYTAIEQPVPARAPERSDPALQPRLSAPDLSSRLSRSSVTPLPTSASRRVARIPGP
ncbi:MAG: MBL fold metallo-hydrolase [Steroidobacteraceae bacterium]